MNILYITYDGLLDPLGQTQILPYLRGLAHQFGHRFVLVSYEKPHIWSDYQQRQSLAQDLIAEGITWLPLAYHKRPSVPATLYDVMRGIVHCTAIVKRYRVQALHIRSYVPMLLGLHFKYWFGLPLIFDMRGLWADERADVGGCSRNSLQYRAIKTLERASLGNADHIVTLTNRSLPELNAMPVLQQYPRPISVIPCCTDTRSWRRDQQSRQRLRNTYGWHNQTVLVYSGSLGGWYRVADMAKLFSTWQQHEPSLHFLVLANTDPTALIAALTDEGVAPDTYTVKKVAAAEVPMWLSAADVALSLITPSYAKLASSPTKYAEYLACGLPIIANSDIGDTSVLLEDDCIGVAVSEFTPAAYTQVWHAFAQLRQDESLSARCRDVAKRKFDIERALQAYHHIYTMVEVDRL
jgi:glycosyltransferase involved in cell wall biosynthesis